MGAMENLGRTPMLIALLGCSWPTPTRPAQMVSCRKLLHTLWAGALEMKDVAGRKPLQFLFETVLEGEEGADDRWRGPS